VPKSDKIPSKGNICCHQIQCLRFGSIIEHKINSNNKYNRTKIGNNAFLKCTLNFSNSKPIGKEIAISRRLSMLDSQTNNFGTKGPIIRPKMEFASVVIVQAIKTKSACFFAVKNSLNSLVTVTLTVGV
jgi:hypothetical protein